MSDVQVLLGQARDLAGLYEPPPLEPGGSWWRANMIATADGAATGDDDRSGGIGTPADREVFELLRGRCHAVVVGAGTARDEDYSPAAVPIVLVSRSARVPEGLRGADPGRVRLATTADAEHLAEARDLLGSEHVLVVGRLRVDLAVLRERLRDLGLVHVLCEGGPRLLRDLLDEGVLDELCTTTVARVVAGDRPRITAGAPVDVPLRLHTLAVAEATLLARWLVGDQAPAGRPAARG